MLVFEHRLENRAKPDRVVQDPFCAQSRKVQNLAKIVPVFLDHCAIGKSTQWQLLPGNTKISPEKFHAADANGMLAKLASAKASL